MEDFWINVGITAVLQLLKDAKKKEQFKKALFKVRNAINAAFPGE